MLNHDVETAPQRRSGRLKRLAPIAVGIVIVVWLVFLSNQIGALREYAWRITPGALLAAVGLGALYYLGLALCWALLLRSIRSQAVPLVAAVRVWLFSMISRYIPGNVWHILSRTLMAQQLGVSRTAVASSASIEQLLTILAALGITVLTLPAWRASGSQVLEPLLGVGIVAAMIIGLACLHPLVLGTLLNWLSRRLKRPELAWSYRYTDILVLTLFFGVAQLFSGLALAAVIGGVTDVDFALLPLIVGGAAAAWLLGYLSLLTPSGLGVREGILTGILALALPLPVAAVTSLLFRVALTLGELLAVLTFWGIDALKKHDRRDVRTEPK